MVRVRPGLASRQSVRESHHTRTQPNQAHTNGRDRWTGQQHCSCPKPVRQHVVNQTLEALRPQPPRENTGNGDALLCTAYNEAKEREIQSLQSFFADSLENKHHWQQCNAIEQPQETCGTTREVRALRIAGTRTEEHEPKNIAMETLCSSGMNFRIIVVYTA